MLARSPTWLPRTGLIHRCSRVPIFKSGLTVGVSPYIGADLVRDGIHRPRRTSRWHGWRRITANGYTPYALLQGRRKSVGRTVPGGTGVGADLVRDGIHRPRRTLRWHGWRRITANGYTPYGAFRCARMFHRGFTGHAGRPGGTNSPLSRLRERAGVRVLLNRETTRTATHRTGSSPTPAQRQTGSMSPGIRPAPAGPAP